MNPTTDTTPWHRQFWPWFLIALPLTVVLGCALTIWLALRSPNALVVDDYYREGLAINESLQQEQRAAAMHVSARLRYDHEHQRLLLQLSGADAEPALDLRFIHPVSAHMDQAVQLERLEPGQYAGSVNLALQRWYVRLSGKGTDGGWLLQGEFDPSVRSSLVLEP